MAEQPSGLKERTMKKHKRNPAALELLASGRYKQRRVDNKKRKANKQQARGKVSGPSFLPETQNNQTPHF